MEIQRAVYFVYGCDSVDDEVVWVGGLVEDDYVAVWVICVEVFRVYSLENKQVADVQGSGKRMRPTVACPIVWDAHTACWDDDDGVWRVEGECCAEPDAEEYENDYADDGGGLDVFVLPEFLELCCQWFAFR
jgi:hypothetical protein